jgi:tetratricopeptide (TPR) repeat protein
MHPGLANTLNNLGSAELLRDRPDAAEAYFRNALAILERTVGPDDPQVDRILVNLGELMRERGDLEGASAMLQRALASRERRLGPSHHDVGLALIGLGRVHNEQGRREAAQVELARAVAILERGDDVLALARAHLRLGQVQNDRTLVAQARDVLAGSPSERNLVRNADEWLAAH